MLEIKKITKRFGGIIALDSCSLEIKKGKITALIGPNGSGKTTLFNIISRLIKENDGKIKLGEKNFALFEDFEAAKEISRTFQEVRLFKNLTVGEHLEIAMQKDYEFLRKSFFKRREKENRVKKILNLVGLEKEIGSYASELSYGQRKLLDLAMSLAKPHEILMLDEPVAGINPALREKIKRIIRELKGKNETIILIEHDMNFVMGLADYIFVLNYGKVISHGAPKKIQKDRKVLESYIGE